jgi:hypothetical protein
MRLALPFLLALCGCAAANPLGGMVTMDFSPVRLTVQLDGANRVQSAHCG